MYTYYSTVEPLNKGNVGDNAFFYPLFEVLKVFGSSSNVLYREVYYTVSLLQRVHYQRFPVLCVQILLFVCTCMCMHIWYAYRATKNS